MTFPMPFFSAGRAPILLSQVGFSQGGTVSIPAGIESGDLALFMDFKQFGNSETYPSGFTGLATKTGAFSRANLSCRVLDGSEGGNNVSGQSSAAARNLLILRPTAPIGSVAGGMFGLASGSNGANLGTVSMGSRAAPAILIAGVYASCADPIYYYANANFSSATDSVHISSGNTNPARRARYRVWDAGETPVDLGVSSTGWSPSGANAVGVNLWAAWVEVQ
jgi:hypothetical protein